MSFDFESPEDVDLAFANDWEHQLHEDAEDELAELFQEHAFDHGVAYLFRELFTCSRSVLRQSWDNVAFILALCLIWRMLQTFLVHYVRWSRNRALIPVCILHIASVVEGIILLNRFFEGRATLILGFATSLALIFALNLELSFLSDRLGIRFSVLSVVVLCLATQIYGEFQMVPIQWHQIRGSVMILIMKSISFASDLSRPLEMNEKSDGLSVPPLSGRSSICYRSLAWFSYALCPATLVFGPWIGFSQFEPLVFPSYRNPDTGSQSCLSQLVKSLKHLVVSLAIASFALVWSTCISHLLSFGVWQLAWLDAYVASQSFRFSHYFVSYSSEAFLASFGVGYSIVTLDSESGESRADSPIHVTHMLEMEVPRSLVDVVVNWNLPMHRWLKQYVYKPVRPYGHIYAILATYTTSSLLHGMNFQLSAVLLSIGMFAYIEFLLRDELAFILDACVASRRCRVNCSHTNKTGFWVSGCNFAFGCLAVFHLAYLAVMFDTSEQQEHGYSMSHALRKWSDLGFLNHYVALATYIFYRYIS